MMNPLWLTLLSIYHSHSLPTLIVFELSFYYSLNIICINFELHIFIIHTTSILNIIYIYIEKKEVYHNPKGCI